MVSAFTLLKSLVLDVLVAFPKQVQRPIITWFHVFDSVEMTNGSCSRVSRPSLDLLVF